MEITEVKIFLKEGQDKKLKAYATLTFDNCFVVRNVKVIEGNKGMFVAMPSRKVKDPCPKCHFRNAVRSKFCNQCGASLPQAPAAPRMPMAGDDMAKQSEHKDIAHPITAECRDYIQKKVLEYYEKEKKSPSPLSLSPSPSSSQARPAEVPVVRKAHVEEDNDIEL